MSVPASDVPTAGPLTTAAPTLFGREPAMVLNVLTAVIAIVSSSIFTLTVDQQGTLNTVVATVLGLIVAVKVKGGTWAAALLALVQGLIAALIAFKFDLSPDLQAGILLLTTAIGGFATRQIVTAPEPPAVPGSSAVA